VLVETLEPASEVEDILVENLIVALSEVIGDDMVTLAAPEVVVVLT